MTPEGVDFALYSGTATAVTLLLYDAVDRDITVLELLILPLLIPALLVLTLQPNRTAVAMDGPTDGVWHVHVDGAGAGQLYGYRVEVRSIPRRVSDSTPRRALLDPYAKAISGKFVNTDNVLLAYEPTPMTGPSTAGIPWSNRPQGHRRRRRRVRLAGDTSPDLALEELIIYEVHAKGFTAHESSGVSDPERISASSRRSRICGSSG